MRSTIWAVVLLSAGAMGCYSMHRAEPRGETMRLHGGSVVVVFTNATPARMCGLHMSYEDQADYGDNWLPEGGLASGKSIEFRVKQGTYKARWNTCSTAKQPYFAATLWREMGFEVDQETQLFAYVADAVSPTKRAAVLGRDHKVVRFQGQQIGGPDWNKPQPQIAATSTKSQQTVIASDRAITKRVDLSEFCETRPHKKSAAKLGKQGKARVGVRGPSLKRSHDVRDAKVRYRVRR